MEDYERMERELLDQSGRVATLGECFAWLERCNECIESLECSSKRPRLTVGHRQSAVARIARLEGARTLLEQRSLAWREIDAAFANRVLTGAVINSRHIEPRQFLEDAESVVLERVRGAIDIHDSVKVNTAFNGEFIAGDKRTVMGINSKNCELYRCTDLREWYASRVIVPTLASLEEHEERDSGWALSRILNLTVNVNKLNPMRAGCHVTLPEKFKRKEAVVNVRSMDNACFAWAVVAALYPADNNVNRTASYPHYSKVLNFADIEFPVTLKDVAKFERSNTVSVNVYGIEDGDILPLRLTDCKRDRHVNLLYVQDGDVSESDYAHAENVWQRFSVRTLGEYSDLYLKTDVLLLADVFENFRDSCVASYGLDPAHYYTLPGFTWDAMLKHTRVKFELLTDIDMVMFVERGIRGDLSQCSGRYARANNRYMQAYDPSEPSSYLMYYDVNNLYGWAMCQPLPYADFAWVDDAHNFDYTTVALDSPTGYILEVDLEYPRRLHDAHADLPFCPTRAKPPGKRDDKLLATVRDKQRYVVHYRNLQQCTRHGLRVTKIHRVLRFAQSAWLRDYIELNTLFRTRARNDFEKNLYKLMNNAVFGKTMENVRERETSDDVGRTVWRGGVDRETEFPQLQRLRGEPDSGRIAKTRGEIRQADLRGYVHPGHFENVPVRVSPRVYDAAVSR
ncbi:hypothetical protein ALC62_15653 [Cyphomyrmex costatus]|uniref:DNA-directed DNA polymerase n=1 Tax=Cyphomyrmex costatus TaxID=456900 RepID=A0A151I6L6_9HYME|nr:hypothetical protein ALC62_15653 [Cyphomyrmex costatus]